MKISRLVKLAHVEHNTLNLWVDNSLTDADVMRALLQAWRNMPHQVHFEQRVVSATDAQALHANAKYYDELDQVSRITWDYALFVSHTEYEARKPALPGRKHRPIILLKLADPDGETHYAVQKFRDLGRIRALAEAQILRKTGLGPRDSFYEYQITFRDAAIFDFLRVGMCWRFYTSGALCPSCLCVETQVELEMHKDFVTHDAAGLLETMIVTSLNQCRVCETQWEQTEYSWHTEFIY